MPGKKLKKLSTKGLRAFVVFKKTPTLIPSPKICNFLQFLFIPSSLTCHTACVQRIHRRDVNEVLGLTGEKAVIAQML